MHRAFISGLSGPDLLDREAEFLSDSRPWGVILFARNMVDADQVRRLTLGVRDTMGDPDYPILIDQEGGRVQRFGPPHCRAYPASARYGEIYTDDRAAGIEAAKLSGQLIGDDLRRLGINVDCLPVLDLPVPGSSRVIGDRALALSAQAICDLGAAQVAGLRSVGVQAVMKHMPGHGRAEADTHTDIARVDEPLDVLDQSDFVPFRTLADMLDLGMTAHVIFSAVDSERPATQSPVIIDNVIRKRIGFNGALMTDDISMEALDGSVGQRAERALQAGCDLVLHCNGILSEMESVAAVSPELTGEALGRTENARAGLGGGQNFDRSSAEHRFDHLLGASGTS